MVASVYEADQNSYASDVTQFNIDAPPGGWQVGDVVAWNAVIAASTARTFTLRDGTTTLTKTVLHGPVANDSSWGEVAYRVLTAVPSGTLNILINAAVQGSVAWQVLRGVDLTQPVEAFVVSTSSGSTPHAMPAITTTVDGCLITGGIIQGSGSASWTAPSPWTIQADGTRRNGIVATRGVQTSAGTIAASSWTMPGGNAAAQLYVIAWRPAAPPEPPIEATLMSEAYPGASGDVADGAAIIPNPTTPANSVVLATNKDANGGLYVLDMDGEILSSVTGFAANSVDWRDTTGLSGWDGRILVMTCDRNSGSYALRFFWFNRTTRTLTSAGTIPVLNEPYGTCLGINDGTLYAYMTERGPDDTSPREFYQASLVRSGDTVSLGSIVRQFTIPSVVEGMTVADDHNALLMSQEDVGLFALDSRAGGGNWDARLTVDLVGGGNLVADVEDVAVAYTADGPKVLVSSQGDNSYHVYAWDEVAEEYVHEQRFTIARPDSIQVAGTDGLDVCIANLGPSFPNGLIVVHDDGLDPSRFAFVDAEPIFGEIPSGTEYNLTPEDDVALTDIVVLNRATLTADGVGISDAVSLSRTRGTADGVDISDDIESILEASRTASDEVSITDEVTAVIGVTKSAADDVDITDDVTILLKLERSFNDSVGITDQVDVVLGGSVEEDDTVGITDTIDLDRKLQIEDSVAIEDEASTQVERDRTGTDTVNITDDLAITRGLSLADTVDGSDQVDVLQSLNRVIGDHIGISDSVSVELAGAGSIVTNDDVIIADEVIVTGDIVRASADSIEISDLVVITQDRVLSFPDVVGVIDLVQLEINKGVSDSLSITDEVTIEIVLAGINPADVVSITDQVQAVIHRVYDIADVVGIADTVVAIPDIDTGLPAPGRLKIIVPSYTLTIRVPDRKLTIRRKP